MRALSMLTTASIAATALLAVAGTGCGSLEAIAQDILDHKNSSSGSSGCVLNGVAYAEGDSYAKDECNTCYCKAGGFTCSSTTCGSTGGPAPYCKEFPFAVYDVCMSVDQFQAEAKLNCDKQKLVVSGVGLDNDCDGKSAHTGRYTCCTPDASGGTGGSTGSSQSCEKIVDGAGAISCRDYAVWKDRGTQACSARGEALSDIGLGQSCGTDQKSAYSATYVCCGPVAQPGPDKCMRLDGGGAPDSCKPATTWKAYGAEACSALGMTLTDIGYSNGCSKVSDDYGDATYICCAGPAGTGSGKCGVEFNADGSQCQSCWDAKGVMVSTSCAPLPGRAFQ